MLNKEVIKYNGIFFALCGLFSLIFGLTGLGAMAVIFGVVNLFISFVCFIIKQDNKAKTYLLVGGVLLLFGFVLCSGFPFRLH